MRLQQRGVQKRKWCSVVSLFYFVFLSAPFVWASVLQQTAIREQQVKTSSNPPPRWVQSMDACSATCGKGVHRMAPVCWQGEVRVSERDCNPSLRPSVEFIACEERPCSPQPKWIQGDWGTCSSKCGPGWRRRAIRCVIEVGPFILKDVENNRCSNQPKPSEEMTECSSGVAVPCPPFASKDVLCFSPPCRTSNEDSLDGWGTGGGGSPGSGGGGGGAGGDRGRDDDGDAGHIHRPSMLLLITALTLLFWVFGIEKSLFYYHLVI